MINGKTVSVLITTYHRKRADDAIAVARAWCKQPVEQVWLLDNAGHCCMDEMDGRDYSYWQMGEDLKTRADYGVALLTDGDLIICADDDIVPKPGFAQDLVDGMDATGAGFVGVIGRVFNDPEYRKTTFYRASKIDEPKRVDFTGVCYMAKRKYFGFDTRGMPVNADDLWHCRRYPEASKFVIPTDKYENLPTCNDGTAMFKNPELAAQRQAYYAEWWEQEYSVGYDQDYPKEASA